MTVREEVVKTLAAAFFVQVEWKDHSRSYQHTESLWYDHLKAAESIQDARGNEKRSIMLRHLQVLNTGSIVWHDVKPVWRAGKWVSEEHDPRASDPQYREYLRLKAIYNEAE